MAFPPISVYCRLGSHLLKSFSACSDSMQNVVKHGSYAYFNPLPHKTTRSRYLSDPAHKYSACLIRLYCYTVTGKKNSNSTAVIEQVHVPSRDSHEEFLANISSLSILLNIRFQLELIYLYFPPSFHLIVVFSAL